MALFTVYDRNSGTILKYGDMIDPECMETETRGVIVGAALDDSKYRIDPVTLEPVSLEIDLTELTRNLLWSIDQDAEGVRGLFITNTSSQPAVYMAKETEAEALMLDENVSEVQTPNLTREAARLGTTRFAVAVSILTQAHTWRQVSAIIEDRRLGAKDLVRAATTEEEARAAAVIDWTDIRSLA